MSASSEVIAAAAVVVGLAAGYLAAREQSRTATRERLARRRASLHDAEERRLRRALARCRRGLSLLEETLVPLTLDTTGGLALSDRVALQRRVASLRGAVESLPRRASSDPPATPPTLEDCFDRAWSAANAVVDWVDTYVSGLSGARDPVSLSELHALLPAAQTALGEATSALDHALHRQLVLEGVRAPREHTDRRRRV